MKIHLANSKFLQAVRSAFQNFKMQVHTNITIFLLLALRVSGNRKSDNYSPDLQDDDKPQDYSYSYAVNDIHTGDQKNQWEKKEGDVVTGSYSVAEPDGSIRTVEYTADDKYGFKAVVKYSRPAHKEVQKDALDYSKIQLDHNDVHLISADHLSNSQPINTKSTLEAQPIKTDYVISKDQYEDKSVINKWNPVITKPRGFQTVYKQDPPNETPYQNVHSTVQYISTASSNDEHNINTEEPSYTTSFPTDLSTSEQNRGIINPGERDLNFNQQQYFYPVYEYQYRDTRDSQKYQNTYFQPVISSTRSQRSNNHLEATYNTAPYFSSSAPSAASGLKYTSDTGNQYKIMNPSYSVNYLQDFNSFKPIQNIIPIDVSKTNLLESNLNPNQQKHFYPSYNYDDTRKLNDDHFQPVISSGSTPQLSGTVYKSPYELPALLGIRNYDTNIMAQYPMNRNNYQQDQYSLPFLNINKQLGSHQQVNVQNSRFARLYPRSTSNREYVKYAKTVTW